ncbi:MAG: Sapep family Mn(2+)-dependent dipeptidase [Firmicutes bacterium]|nr:Sapep family Mn(2+)-dependent dipeptidase [Bacillota bacterium]
MDEMIVTLNELCGFKSVTERTDDPACPYGTETKKALEFMLKTCSDFGFRVKNLDDQIGYAEIGEGDEIFGILAHLDVVPAGEGWTYTPWGATLADDGYMYGRGVVDDKGPAVASVYAMKDLLDSGCKFKKRIRIIFGQTEEAGDWDDMKYYREHEELPSMGITPDADFPALYGEKGILHFTLSMPKKKAGFISVSGGQASNMVADEAKGSVDCNGVIRDFYEQGKAAHGSMPQNGKNAISMLMAEVGDATNRCGMANFYNRYIGFDIHGERFNLDIRDEESGRLTLNVGKIEMTEETVDLKMDIRYPVTFTLDEITQKIEAVVRNEGLTLTVDSHKAPIYMDKDGELITELVKVYHDMTGLNDEAVVIGGGTYARAMPNIVAYGPMIPGRECTEHQRNERIMLDDYLLLRKIYGEALRRICTE